MSKLIDGRHGRQQLSHVHAVGELGEVLEDSLCGLQDVRIGHNHQDILLEGLHHLH